MNEFLGMRLCHRERIEQTIFERVSDNFPMLYCKDKGSR